MSLSVSLSVCLSQDHGDQIADYHPRGLQIGRRQEDTQADRCGRGRGGGGGREGVGRAALEHATRLEGVQRGGSRGETEVGQGTIEETSGYGGKRLQSQPMRRPKA